MLVATDTDMLSCVTRARRGGLACGDWVEVAPTSAGEGVVESVEPRRSLFYRSDAQREKLVAANVSQIVIVTAALPEPNEDLLNRCLAAAEHARVAASIVLNKIDLAPEAASARERLALYRSLGYRLIELCAKRDVSALATILAGHTSALVGQSGVGKSTLVNRLAPAAQARTAGVSAAAHAGRHTTTSTSLYRIDATSAIIDSPGIQAFGLNHVAPEDLAAAFIEFRPYLGHCRFANCRHVAEPDCAVAAAAASGAVSGRRLSAYRAILHNTGARVAGVASLKRTSLRR